MRGADRQHYGEFLAAEARQRVHGANDFRQRLCHRLQHHVAGDMPMLVVDLLEVVDVQHQQQGGLARAGHAVDFALDHGAEMAAVGQSRERVAQ